jgi:hypothetical protein
MVFPVAWLLQRKTGYGLAAVFLVPIFVVLLTLTKPHYGAEFWSIFRHEVYLNPVYAPRGLLVCFLLLSLGVFTRLQWDRGTLALCFLIGFAVTSWEALTTPSPPNIFFEDGSFQFLGQGAEVVKTGWGIVTQQINQHVPPDYRTAARVGVSVCPLLAFFLLLFPSYRKLPKDFIRDFMWEHREEFPTYVFLGVLLGFSGWAFWAATKGPTHGAGTGFLLGVLSIPVVLAMIFVLLSSIVWCPLCFSSSRHGSSG